MNHAGARQAPTDRGAGCPSISAHIVALSGVSMTLERGEVHCLLGDNGAGKSTLIRPCPALQADSGEILFEGKPSHFARPRDALDRRHRNGLPGSRHGPADVGDAQLLHGPRAGEGIWASSRSSGHGSAPSAIAREEMMRIGIDLRDPRASRSARCRAASANAWRSPARSISAPRY